MGQLSKNLKIVEQGDGASLIYTNKDNSTINLLFNKSGVYVNGTEMTDAMVGVDPTPVSTRTNNPIVGVNTVNENIDALDAAIGADNTPITRTFSPTVANTTINTKVQVLDTAIGADAAVVGTPKTIVTNSSVFTNLYKLDTYKSVQTVKKTIGNVGVASCDFNFVTGANANEQPIDLGAILPAKCRLLDIFVFTDAAFTNLGVLSTDVGLTTGSGGLLIAANNTAINTIMQPQPGASFTLVAISASAQHVWVNVTPTNNWNSATPVGKVSVYVTYVDVTNI